MKKLFGACGAACFVFLFVLLLLTEPPALVRALLLAVAVHESGHLLALRLLRCRVHRLTLLPFGMRLERDALLCGYGREALLYLAGPLASLAGAAAVLGNAGSEGRFDFFMLTLGFAGFNLLPLPGTDGSGALRCLAAARSEDGVRGVLAVRRLNLGVAVLLFGFVTARFLLLGRGVYPLVSSFGFCVSGLTELLGE